MDVFRLLAFLNITRFPLNLLGQALKSFNDAQVSLNRLNRFFLLPTLTVLNKQYSENPTIIIEDATFTWTGEVSGKVDKSKVSEKTTATAKSDIEAGARLSHVYFSLRNVTFRPIKRNELVAIVGYVGSGKSSLLSALLDEMPLSSGKYEIEGTISYCAQTPW